MLRTLRVIAWDDPRCTDPLEAAAVAWEARTGGRIEISRRPLTAFNDQPLRELSPACDVMIIDFPHVSQAMQEDAIIPIEEIVDDEVTRAVSANAIGSAQASFLVDGVNAAFCSDAACHVAAHRPASLSGYGASAPETWDGVMSLAENFPGSVALALYPTDAIVSLMSIAAGTGAAPDGGKRFFSDQEAAKQSIDLLVRLTRVVEDYCWQCTPQALFKAAQTAPEIAYVPLTFGYVRCTRPEEGGWRFTAPPTDCGSTLGGAGMAVSSQSDLTEFAAEFVSWYCGDEGQVLAGKAWGQPSGLSAWNDPEIDEMTSGFYSGTRETQAAAWVRPLNRWWPAVQEKVGEHLVRLLRANEPPEKVLCEIESMYQALRSKL
ncbi:MAG: extracellular solute-binding protein [Boseongicola sp. SB0673_bin_14]|nr:extracellular solute-binding protein [Boseongicola sp. SB0673_bin_14]